VHDDRSLPPIVNVTVPVGALGLLEVSSTVPVQVAGLLTGTEPGAQTSDVAVGSNGKAVTERLNASELPECVRSAW